MENNAGADRTRRVGHDKDNGNIKVRPEEKRAMRHIMLAAVLFIAGLLTEGYLAAGLCLTAYLMLGWKVLWKAVSGVWHGRIFDENFLMAVATIGALAIGKYAEGTAVMLFCQIGEWFEDYAVNRSKRSIAALMAIRPDHANIAVNGKLRQVRPETVKPGTRIIIKPGERIPLDGQITEGNSILDMSSLTGEPLPYAVSSGMAVISGSINKSGLLQVKTTKSFGESTVMRILALSAQAGDKKAHMENFITRFARYYTPAVVAGAVLLALVPSWLTGAESSIWLYRALTFLVISCPCALVISVPLTFFSGIGGASRCGILVKGSNYLETLARTGIMAFDKTGTLTKGKFAVTAIEGHDGNEAEVLAVAAYAECVSDHPVAAAIRQAYGKEIDCARVTELQETAGYGISAQLDGRRVLAGNARFLQENNIVFEPGSIMGTIVYIAAAGKFLGSIIVEDELKPDAKRTIHDLAALGVTETVMLTGDNAAVGRKMAAQLGMSKVYTQLLPADKLARLEGLLADKTPQSSLAFVGDGINDAPVLARADVGIAMGGAGSDAAIEAADIVLMTDEPGKIVTAMQLARRTLRIAKQNVIFAIGVKAVILLLGAVGLATLWSAVFADVGVSMLAIMNAMRAMDVRNRRAAG